MRSSLRISLTFLEIEDMITYDLTNNYDTPLRLVIEPEGLEYDLPPGGQVTVSISGEPPAFSCQHFRDNEGFQCVSFWPEKGIVEIIHQGKNIIEMIR